MTQISPEMVGLIQETLFGCERCSPQAVVPFEQVLRGLTVRNGEAPDYILLAPARCPSCLAPVSRKTLVEFV